MFKAILSLIDRCLFACLFIIGVQAPEFIQQYMQRLAGHTDESNLQLQQFQQIANINFNGELTNLINHYLANADSAIRQTGNFVSNLFDRNQLLTEQLSQLEQKDYVNKLVYFVQHANTEIAKATLNSYQMAIPLETQALVTGFCFAFGIFLLMALISGLTKIIWNKLIKRPRQNELLN